MDIQTGITLGLIAIDITLLGLLLYRRDLARERVGRVLFLVAALALPAVTAFAAVNVSLERSHEVTFCLSCHEMKPYGDSLKADDEEMVPTVHYQNNLVHKDTACYECHTNYTMFGPFQAKLQGLRHVYIHYLGKPPEKIQLYEPYPSSICLHCHTGARAFEQAKGHREEREKILSGATSCLTSGCHDVTHEVNAGNE